MIYFDGRDHCIVLFGSGLIGNSVATYLSRLGHFRRSLHPYSWSSAQLARVQREEIFNKASQASRIDVIWAAGKAGFGAIATETELEMSAFRDLLDFIARRYPESSFHLVSSAGGLFEGMTCVESEDRPRPRRPYGDLKLCQEAALEQSGLTRWAIYRPSTVYGFSESGRLGVVSALLQNAARNSVTTIVGRPDTLRDYVFVGDIGRFISSRTGQLKEGGETHFLVSGKPTSMLEIIRYVERIVARKLYLSFDPRPSNALSMSIRQSALPKNWVATDLQSGIAATSALIRARHLVSNKSQVVQRFSSVSFDEPIIYPHRISKQR